MTCKSVEDIKIEPRFRYRTTARLRQNDLPIDALSVLKYVKKYYYTAALPLMKVFFPY